MRKCSSNVVDHEYKFYCNTCTTDLKCGAGGINDIDKHVNSLKHNENANTIRRKLKKYITKYPQFLLSSTIALFATKRLVFWFSFFVLFLMKRLPLKNLYNQNSLHLRMIFIHRLWQKLKWLYWEFNTIPFSHYHLTPYIQSEFKWSKAAENVSCRRTKTAAIVNCLGSHYRKELISDLRSTRSV